ncbi:MAG: fibronectin type III domain-containing protein [Thermoplasmatota archaeon]
MMLGAPAFLFLNTAGVSGMYYGGTNSMIDFYGELDGAPVDGFIENGGQWDESIRFIARADFGHIAIGDGFVILNIIKRPAGGEDGKMDDIIFGSIIKMVFEGANDAEPTGLEPFGYKTNFFIGKDQAKWSTDLDTFSKVVYQDLWDGIDLVYTSGEQGLKYEYICRPGSDPSEISFHFEGADSVKIEDDSLEIMTPIGVTVTDGGLKTFYQGSPSSGIDVEFSLKEDGSVCFNVPEYDRMRTLIIDPFIFCTYIGGVLQEGQVFMTTDADGNIYLAGFTSSMDFPVTIGSFQTRLSDQADGFVMKMKPDGSAPIFSTYIGGSGWEDIRGIYVDTDTDIYITGSTDSRNFPTTKGAFNETMNNYTADYTTDLVVVKLDSTGSQLIYSTYIGGKYIETMNGNDMIMVDRRGCAHVAAESLSSDFPLTKDAYDKYNNASEMGWRCAKVVLFKLTADGSDLIYSTYIGGEGWDYAASMWLDGNGCVYLTGSTGSSEFPVTPGAFDTDLGWNDLYLLKFDIAKSNLIYGTYYGGMEYSCVMDITVDGEGRAYVTGNTMSPDFPITEDAYNTQINGEEDVFVTAFDPKGSSLHFSTFVGGGYSEMGRSIYLDAQGNVLIGGNTISDDFPRTVGSKIPDSDEYDIDAFLTILNSTGRKLIYSTIIGGSSPTRDSEDMAYSILPYLDDQVLLAGATSSSDFPVSEDCFDSSLGGSSDSFLLRTYLSMPPTAPLNVGILQGDGFLNLSWDVPEDDGGMPITEYLVYRGDREDGLKLYSEDLAKTYFVDEELEMGKRYYYTVQAVNGMGPGKMSEIVSEKAVCSPTPPQHLRIEEESGQITLTWMPSYFDGALKLQGYRLYKHTDGQEEPEIIELPDIQLEYTDKNVLDGTNYSYYVTAYNDIGESGPSNVKWSIPMGLPSPPVNLTAFSGNGFVLLTWEYPADDGGSTIVKYRIYQGIPFGEAIIWRFIDTSDTEFNDTLVQIGKEYRYYVTAINEEGESLSSNAVTGMPSCEPSPPENVESVEGNGYVIVSWSEPSFLGGLDILGYRLYRSSSGSAPEVIADLDQETFFLKDKDVVNGGSYAYYVTAVNSFGESEPSERVDGNPASVPGEPLSVSVSTSCRENRITWAAPSANGGSAVIGYSILRKTQAGEFQEIGTVGSDTKDYNDEDVEPGTIYTYIIKAENRMGLSGPSDDRTVTAVGEPGCPLVVGMISGDGYVVLEWSCPVNTGGCDLTGIRIFRTDDSALEPAMIKDAFPSDTTYNDTDVENGVEYTYYISAVNQYGNSEQAEIGSAVPLGRPDAASDLKAVVTGNRVELSWSAPTDDGGCCILRYEIYRKLGDGQFARIAIVEGNELKYTDNENKGSGKYTYKVVPVNEIGAASGSSEVTAEVKEVDEKGSFVEDQLGLMITVPIILLLLVLVILILSRNRKNGNGVDPVPSPAYTEDEMIGYQQTYEGPMEGYENAANGYGDPNFGQE